MNLLVLGVSGMLGNAMFRVLADEAGHAVYGSARSESAKHHFSPALANNILTGIDVENMDVLVHLFERVKPHVVINCVGLVKQLLQVNDPLYAIPMNALLPHRLARLAQLVGARLVHISTDCVFTGRRGGYVESDEPDATDLYGRSKLLGEVDYPNAITLRTSIVGHELTGSRSLLGWFLSQDTAVKGYTRSIFSGLPTCELARVVRDFVLPNPQLHGVFHVAAEPISKYKLLTLVNETYGKGLLIEPDDQLKIDRSLNASRFREATGYVAPTWPQLVAQMHAFK